MLFAAIPILLSVLSGLAGMAYHAPSAYRKIERALVWLPFWALTINATWLAAIMQAKCQGAELVPMQWAIFGTFAWLAYIAFLSTTVTRWRTTD